MSEEQDTTPAEPQVAPEEPATVAPHDPLDDPVSAAEQAAIDRELERKGKPITVDPPAIPPPVPPKPTLTKEPPAWMWWAAFGLVVAGTIFAIVYTYRQGRINETPGDAGGSPRPS